MNDTSSGGLSTDSPITDLDADCLGYRPFAKNIATILDNATTREDCLVLGIHGKWGSGKTSAINLVIKELKNRQENLPKKVNFLKMLSPFYSFIPDWMPKYIKQRTEIIHFSPWLFSNQENLTTAFFHELEKQLDNTWGNIKGSLKTIAVLTLPSLETLSYFNPTTSKLVGNTTQHLIKSLQKRPSLEQAKKALNRVLKAQKRPILIIIDDIDRLPADEMRQIFRMVKSVADLPYVTYLLGFDREIVERALEKDTDLEGPHWIEKIIQGSFDLPHIISFRIELYFWNKLKTDIPDLYERLHGSTVDYFKQYLYPQLKNPRQVNRLINALIVGWLSVKDVVYPMCFIIIESWRLFEHDLYTFIKTYTKDLLTHANHYLRLNSLMNNSQPTENKLQEQIETYNQKLNININSFFQLEGYDQSGKQVKIFTERNFYHYFTYNHNTTLLSIEELIEIESKLDHFEEAKKIIEKFSLQTLDSNLSKNRALIEDWHENIPSYPTDKIIKIITFIVYISDCLIQPKPSALPEYNIQTSIEFLLDKSFNQLNSDSKKNLLIKIFKYYPFCFLLMFSFNKLCFKQDLNIEENRDIFINCLKESKEEIKNIYQEKLEELFITRQESSFSIHILLLFFNLLDQEWIKQFLTQDLNYTTCIMRWIIDDTNINIEKNKDWLSQYINIKEYSQITMMHYVADKMIHLRNLADTIIEDQDQDQDQTQKQTAESFLDIYNKYIQPL